MATYRRDSDSKCEDCGGSIESKYVSYNGLENCGEEWEKTGKSRTSGWAKAGGRGCKECGKGDCGYDLVKKH